MFGINSLIAQDLYMDDFSIPICGNGNGQDTLNFMSLTMVSITIAVIKLYLPLCSHLGEEAVGGGSPLRGDIPNLQRSGFGGCSIWRGLG